LPLTHHSVIILTSLFCYSSHTLCDPLQAKLVTALFTNATTSFAPGILRAFACATPGLAPVTVVSSVDGSNGAAGGIITAASLEGGDAGMEVATAAIDIGNSDSDGYSGSIPDKSSVVGMKRSKDAIDLAAAIAAAAAAGPVVPVRTVRPTDLLLMMVGDMIVQQQSDWLHLDCPVMHASITLHDHAICVAHSVTGDLQQQVNRASAFILSLLIGLLSLQDSFVQTPPYT
jgi:hypothetical protein